MPSDKVSRFLAEAQPPTPCLAIDLDIVAETYRRFEQAFPLAAIYYAVKANPARRILEVLSRLNARFDAASIYEVEDCRFDNLRGLFCYKNQCDTNITTGDPGSPGG